MKGMAGRDLDTVPRKERKGGDETTIIAKERQE
jgi:hypothetical protein